MSAPVFTSDSCQCTGDRPVGGPTPSAAQTAPLALTLDDAVRRAVDNNPDLAIVRLDTDVETARVDETRTAFTPVFSTVLGRSSAVTPPANSLLGERGVDVERLCSRRPACGSDCRGDQARGASRGTPREPRPTTR